MADHAVVLILLTVLTVCAVIMTGALLSIMQDLHRVVREARALVPSASRVLQDAGQSLRHTRKILSRADSATRSVEAAVEQVTELWGGALDGMSHMGQRMGKVFGVQFGNGTRVDPRRGRRK